ncbi:MAG TPA: prepilin-type N-terminal cleavage/methylation domain-containing protein [Kofleriaceae bacterium]
MRRQAGFTLLELMIAVAVIAILASIAVPAWVKQSSQKKARSEVSTMFAELSAKEEQYMTENSTWMPTGTPGAQYATGFCPAAPSSQGQADTDPCIAANQPWYNLRVGVPTRFLYCSYNIYTGDSTVQPTLPAELAFVTLPTSPIATNWFVLEAHCDMDNDAATDSYYYFSSFDSRIQVTNEGT